MVGIEASSSKGKIVKTGDVLACAVSCKRIRVKVAYNCAKKRSSTPAKRFKTNKAPVTFGQERRE